MINIKNLNKFNNNDKGVSPVIGVILMVAATIVIAGVIMAMLGGFAPVEPPRSVSVAVTHHNATYLAVVFHGGPDGGTVANLSIRVGAHAPVWMNTTAGATTLLIGNRTVVPNATAGPDNDHVIVTAIFTDGIQQVVLDTRV